VDGQTKNGIHPARVEDREFAALLAERVAGVTVNPLYARTVLERERQRHIDAIRDIDQALYKNRYKTIAKVLR